MRSSEQGSGGDASEGLASYWWRSIAEESPKGDGTSPHARVVSELERLAAAGTDSLDELRHRLLSYKPGDLWFPTGGIPKEEMDVPPVITILLVGLAGAGKSSLVDLMYCVLGRAGLVHFTSPADKEGRTVCLEEHNVLRSMRNGFCVFDSRGFDCRRMADGLQEVAEWMRHGVRHRQPCHGAGDDSTSAGFHGFHAVNRFARRRVNCTVVVADLYYLYQSLLSGDSSPLEATGELFHFPPIRNSTTESPVLVLTHGDKLSPEERMAAREKVCAYLGVSEAKGAYDISCLNEYGAAVEEMDPATSYAVGEAVFRALAAADRNHRPRIRPEDWLLLVVSWLMCGLAAIFAFLSSCCAKIGKRK